LPEETREAYLRAISQGADFIEGDVVLTKDCVPIMRHEPDLTTTTNAIAMYGAQYNKTYTIDNLTYTGVFTVDLTLAQIKALNATQRLPQRDQEYNDKGFKVITLAEYLEIALAANRTVGTYPETKHPTWHDSLKIPACNGTSLTDIFLNVIKAHGYGGAINSPQWLARPIFLQSFEVDNLEYLKTKTDLPLIQLTDDLTVTVPYTNYTYASLVTASALKDVAKYATGLGPYKLTIAPNGSTGLPSPNIIDNAHAAGLFVHPYTFRDENNYVEAASPQFGGDIFNEYDFFFGLGMDGAFTDYVNNLGHYLDLKAYTGPANFFSKLLPIPSGSTTVSTSSVMSGR
jgi:glycerophosphoryl diester phosphodiesterase